MEILSALTGRLKLSVMVAVSEVIPLLYKDVVSVLNTSVSESVDLLLHAANITVADMAKKKFFIIVIYILPLTYENCAILKIKIVECVV